MATKSARSRQRSSPETLERILGAAAEEFAARGLAGAQIEAIAREAGVAKQIIYYYYESREGLYSAVLQDINERHLSRIFEIDFASMDAVEGLDRFFGRMFDNYCDEPVLIGLALDFNFHGSVHLRCGEIHRRVLAVYDALVERGIREGAIPAAVDRRACFSFAMLIVSGCFLPRDRAWGFPKPDNDSEFLLQRRGEAMRAIRAILTH